GSRRLHPEGLGPQARRSDLSKQSRPGLAKPAPLTRAGHKGKTGYSQCIVTTSRNSHSGRMLELARQPFPAIRMVAVIFPMLLLVVALHRAAPTEEKSLLHEDSSSVVGWPGRAGRVVGTASVAAVAAVSLSAPRSRHEPAPSQAAGTIHL